MYGAAGPVTSIPAAGHPWNIMAAFEPSVQVLWHPALEWQFILFVSFISEGSFIIAH